MAKKIIVALVILIALLILNIAKQPTETVKTISEQVSLKTFIPADLSLSSVSKIVCYGKDKSKKLILEKANDAWLVKSHYGATVDMKKLADFIDNIKGLSGEFRSNSATVLKDYSLSDDQAIHLEVSSGNKKQSDIHILLGKQADWKNAFVRLHDSSDVYVVNKNLRGEFGLWDQNKTIPEPQAWINKSILNLKTIKAKKITLTWPDKNIILEKQQVSTETKKDNVETGGKSQWALVTGGIKGKTFNSESLQKNLNNLSKLTAIDVVDPANKKAYGLEKITYSCNIELTSGKLLSIFGGRPNDNDNNAYLQIKGREQVYSVSIFEFEKIFPKGESFFDLGKALSIEKGNIGQLTINHNGAQASLSQKDSEWQCKHSKAGFEFDSDKLGLFLDALIKVKPIDYAQIGLNDAGLQTPTIKITFKGNIGQKEFSHKLSIGGPSASGTGIYYKIDNDPTILVLDRALLKDITLDNVLKAVITENKKEPVKPPQATQAPTPNKTPIETNVTQPKSKKKDGIALPVDNKPKTKGPRRK